MESGLLLFYYYYSVSLLWKYSRPGSAARGLGAPGLRDVSFSGIDDGSDDHLVQTSLFNKPSTEMTAARPLGRGHQPSSALQQPRQVLVLVSEEVTLNLFSVYLSICVKYFEKTCLADFIDCILKTTQEGIAPPFTDRKGRKCKMINKLTHDTH
jgi:hypothetical protein